MVEKKGIVTATYTDFTGEEHVININVNVVDPTGIKSIEDDTQSLTTGRSQKVYTPDGRRVDANKLQPGIYIKNGKKVVVK